MKRILILGVALILVLAGCGQSVENGGSGNVDNSPQQPEAGQQENPSQQQQQIPQQ
ncbi:MAG: hypothetical protein ACOCVY_02030 [Patescibacteria group bacterium]